MGNLHILGRSERRGDLVSRGVGGGDPPSVEGAEAMSPPRVPRLGPWDQVCGAVFLLGYAIVLAQVLWAACDGLGKWLS